MKSLYETFGTHKDYELKGIWLEFADASMKVRRAGGSNEEFSRVLGEKLRPHRHAMEAGGLDPKLSRRLLQETYFETVVLEWKNFVNRKGEPMELTLENFCGIMEELPDLWSAVVKACDEMRNFQASNVKEDIEDLVKS